MIFLYQALLKVALPKGKGRTVRGSQLPLASYGRGARLSNMVSASELLVNIVMSERAKDAD